MKDVPRVLLGMLAVALAVGAFALAFSSNPPSPAPAKISSEDAAGAVSVSPTTLAKGADELTTNAGAMAALSGAFAATLSSTVTPADQPGLPPPTPPAISSAAYQQGMILRRNGDYQNAAKSFRAALGEKPEPSSAREIQFRLGETSWLAGDLDGATSAFTALLAQNSDDNLAVRAHYFLSDVFTQRKSYTQAIAELRAYRAQTHTLMGEIDAQIGDLFLIAGNSSQAIAQYELALHDSTLSSSQRVDFLERIAGAETSLGHPEIAATRLGEAFQAASDNETRAEAEYRWGLALDASKDHATALTHWQHALATYPDQDGGYESLVALLDGQASVDDYQRGLADYYSKSYSPAVLAFNRYIAANPKNSAAALYYEGLAYLENGQTSLAVSTFDALLLKYPNDSRRADALYNKARAYDAATDTDKAVAAYNQFADLYPTDSRADDSLWKAAQSLHNAGRVSDARAEYEKLVANFPSSPNSAPAIFIVGFDYYLSEDYVNADASWKKVAKLYPGTVDADRALYWLGKLASSQGNSASAQQYFKQAVTTPHSVL